MVPISGGTREEVWLEAIKHLHQISDSNLEYNLILEITNPVGPETGRSKLIREYVDLMLKESTGLYPVHTVAETIFPFVEYRKNGADGVYNIYPNKVYPLIKGNPGNSKGTYAYRIVRGVNYAGKECNPLQGVVDRLKGQLSHDGGIRCAFELSTDDHIPEVESIPINRNDSFTRGFPCLSHLSFKLSHDRSELHLTAMYRSHDYIQKALGNLLGLARLQYFVAKEIGVSVGILVCHSTLARLDKHRGIGKGRIDKMISDLEG